MIRDKFTSKPKLALGKYEHYKGNLYDLIDLGCHTETHEWFVIYRSLYSHDENAPDVWIRPYEMFIENVRIDDEEKPRFKKIED